MQFIFQETKRLTDLKNLLVSFVAHNIQKQGTKYRCQLDNTLCPSYKAILIHFQTSHKQDIEQLFRVLLYGKNCCKFLFPFSFWASKIQLKYHSMIQITKKSKI